MYPFTHGLGKNYNKKNEHATANLLANDFYNDSIQNGSLHGSIDDAGMRSAVSSDDTTPASTDNESNHNTQLPQQQQQQPQHVLRLVPLVVIIFYNVSGGPFGVEEAIRSAGPFYTLLGFGICPLIWSIQESLITAELTCMYPHPSGGVVWVEEAFGPTAGWMAGFLSWIAGATDNAIYPVMFLDYVIQVFAEEKGNLDTNHVLRFTLIASTSISLAYINWLGLEIVGTMSIVICVIALSPFVIVVLVGMFKVQPHRWLKMPELSPHFQSEEDDAVSYGGGFSNAVLAGVMLRPFINNLFWNFNSFDSTSSYCEEIHDLPKTLPRAMVWSVLMVWLGYVIPLLVLLGASDDDITSQHDWVDGYIAIAAEQIVGSKFVGGWIVFAAGVSNLALFQAELSSDAYKLMGMARKYEHIPKIFATKSYHGTPTYALILGTCVIVILAGISNLDQLIEMLNFNYAFSLLMEYAAFVKLRISKSRVHRPYRIPLGTVGCIAILIPSVVMTLVVLLLASYKTFIASIIANIFGYLIYKIPNTLCWNCFKYDHSPPTAHSPDDDDDDDDESTTTEQHDQEKHDMIQQEMIHDIAMVQTHHHHGL